MLTKNHVLLASVSIFMMGLASPSIANDQTYSKRKMGYIPPYMSSLTHDQKSNLKFYTNNEIREPCQNYRDPPFGFYRDGCSIIYRYKETELAQAKATIYQKSVAIFQVYFDFDDARLDSDAENVLGKTTEDILVYQPRLITVSGYTDSVGTEKYNLNLSEKRAQVVSRFLKTHGIENRLIDEKFFGENNQAIKTQNSIKMQKNRRVQIDFFK